MTSAALAELSNNLLYSAMVVYALALLAYAAELAFSGPRRSRLEVAVEQRELAAVGGGSPPTAEPVPASAPGEVAEREGRAQRLGRVAVSLTVLAFALHLGSAVARGLSAERVPWGNMFEFSVTGALAVTGAFLVMLTRRDLRYLGTFVVLPVLLTLGLAVAVLYTESAQLVPALKSVWLVIHVAAAIVASGILTVAFAQTVTFLVQERRERVPAGERTPSFMDRFPAAAALDRSAYRMHAFAYPIWTFAVIAGAIWAENAWGRYWGWDPKETWAFITWMVYTAYLHARATAGWKGRKAAYVALLGYATFLFNYLVVNIWLVGFHSYAGVG
ncbi:MAG TPA: c-type cytochrome biogenesis protein CcsB [Actinomycetes bacterium]|nr:c-type cytochrome biogenesis protein CcsB [Actinomycetes bacterium]